MILKRFYDEKLAQASYLVGCAATGEAAVIDPNRDVDRYLEAAAGENLRVAAVTETHIHADYVSGSRELAARAGARLFLSDEGGADWKYAFAGGAGAALVRGGDAIEVGNLRLDVVHTPGHTPEHVSFVLTDRRAAPGTPALAFTGDFLFAGDVGRPDLLERAASVAGTMEPGARKLFDTIRRFSEYPDHLQIWPGHGAGSACGKSLGGVPVTTLGYEKRANWAFQIHDEDAFVAEVLAGQPEPPVYFAQMKRINKEGPALLGGRTLPPRYGGAKMAALAAGGASDGGGGGGGGALVVDIRPSAAFAQAYIPGTLHIPEGSLFTNWAGWLLPYDAATPLYLIAESEAQVAEAARDLAMIGLDHVAGWSGPEAVRAYAERGGIPEAVAPLRPEELAAYRERTGAVVLDVRGENERRAGRIPGSVHVPLGYLGARLGELPHDRPVVVQCETGGRSPIAVSALRRAGFADLRNLSGGFAAYRKRGLPAERG